MIYFSTPYAFDKKLALAYDREFQRLPNPDDWLAIMDGDIAFLRADFGHHIQEYIDKYPGTGMFTCYASRCHYKYIIPRDGNDKSADILFHKRIAESHAANLRLEVKPLAGNITGHLMVIRKDIWQRIRAYVLKRTKNETIEAVDTSIGLALHAEKLPILLMRGIYVFHYCRLKEGYKSRAHLGYHSFINIITPCARPENLHKIAESINIPRRMFRWIVVIDADRPATLPDLPKKAEVYYFKDNSRSGNGQRNFALNLITRETPANGFDNFVYFLDDDTLMHPDFYNAVNGVKSDFIHFDQQFPDGSHRIGGTVKVNQVDSGNALVALSLIGSTRWRSDLYNADGFFLQALFEKAKAPVYLKKHLSTYNALRP
ncbi:MAG: glycosyltransferase family A protein [Bacteroidales bacterium]